MEFCFYISDPGLLDLFFICLFFETESPSDTQAGVQSAAQFVSRLSRVFQDGLSWLGFCFESRGPIKIPGSHLVVSLVSKKDSGGGMCRA